MDIKKVAVYRTKLYQFEERKLENMQNKKDFDDKQDMIENQVDSGYIDSVMDDDGNVYEGEIMIRIM